MARLPAAAAAGGRARSRSSSTCAYEYFGLPRDPRLQVDVGDGRRFLAGDEKRWDVIVIDAFFADAIPAHLVTQEFLALARSRLAPGGVVVTNAIGAISGPGSKLFRSIYKTYRTAFPSVLVHPAILPGDTGDEQFRNLILDRDREGDARSRRSSPSAGTSSAPASPGVPDLRKPILDRRDGADPDRRRAGADGRLRADGRAAAALPVRLVFLKHKLGLAPHEQAVPEPRTTACVSETQSPLARGADLEREVRRREEEADARLAAGAAVRHLERARDPVRRHEAERPRRLVVAAAGDDDGAEPVERRRAAVPVGVRQERMAGAPGAVGVERARVGGRRRARPPRGRPAGAVAEPWKRARYGSWVPCAKWREAGAARSRCRRRRPGRRRARAAARARGATVATVIGFSALARGVLVLPRHPDHDRVERLVERASSGGRSRAGAPRRARPTAGRRSCDARSARGRGPAAAGGASPAGAARSRRSGERASVRRATASSYG